MWTYASDHQFAGDAAYINLEIKALHRRAREMPDQTARQGSPADELVGQKRVDFEDSINLGRGHIGPAEAERPIRCSIAPSTKLRLPNRKRGLRDHHAIGTPWSGRY